MFRRFFSAIPGSIKGHVNVAELYHSILGSLGVSSLVGLLVAIMTAISSHAAAIFPDPAVAMSATYSIALVLDLIRRSGHGVDPKPAA